MTGKRKDGIVTGADGSASRSQYQPVQVEVSGARRARAREDVREMIEAMGLSHAAPADVAKMVSKQTFKDYGAYSTLQHVYHGSPYAALLDLYPDLKPWQMRHVPMSYWLGPDGRERAREATSWMLSQLGLLNAPPRELAARVDFFTFARFGLRGMLDRVYGNSPYEALRDVYPALEPWERDNVPRSHWQNDEGRKSARSATLHMLSQLGLLEKPLEAIAGAVTQRTFVENGLYGMLSNVYHNSPYEALHDVFPELKPWQMSRTPLGFWQGDAGRKHAREALSWLLAKQRISESASREQLLSKLTRDGMVSSGLGGMLQQVYGSHIQAAIDDLLYYLAAGSS